MESLGAEAVIAHLGLGANLGDRLANLAEAVRRLQSTPGVEVARCSSVYETEPWGLAEQPSFLNCVLEVATTLDPAPLLAAVKAIEEVMGRMATVRFGPRCIDIDILTYGERVIDWATPDLQVPHPRMTLRAFVLAPLTEIAGDLVLPGQPFTVAELAATVAGLEGVSRHSGPIPLNTVQ